MFLPHPYIQSTRLSVFCRNREDDEQCEEFKGASHNTENVRTEFDANGFEQVRNERRGKRMHEGRQSSCNHGACGLKDFKPVGNEQDTDTQRQTSQVCPPWRRADPRAGV